MRLGWLPSGLSGRSVSGDVWRECGSGDGCSPGLQTVGNILSAGRIRTAKQDPAGTFTRGQIIIENQGTTNRWSDPRRLRKYNGESVVVCFRVTNALTMSLTLQWNQSGQR